MCLQCRKSLDSSKCLCKDPCIYPDNGSLFSNIKGHRMAHLNCCSIPKYIDEIKLILSSYNLHVISLTSVSLMLKLIFQDIHSLDVTAIVLGAVFYLL